MASAEYRGAFPVRRLALIGAVLACLGFVALAVDIPVAKLCRQQLLPGDLRVIIRLSEVFAHAYGATAIFCGLAWLQRLPLRRFTWGLLLIYIPGLVAALLKPTVWRRRPAAFLDELPASTFTSFEGVLPGIFTDSPLFWSVYSVQSLPSGHAATCAGLTVALMWNFPRGRWLFLAGALLAGMQRVESGAHFPSDVMWGAAISCWVCAALMAAFNRRRVNRVSTTDNSLPGDRAAFTASNRRSRWRAA